jgi:hypothetical protein
VEQQTPYLPINAPADKRLVADKKRIYCTASMDEGRKRLVLVTASMARRTSGRFLDVSASDVRCGVSTPSGDHT